jgi:hypothetical protein
VVAVVRGEEMLSEPLHYELYFDSNKENVDPLTGRLSPAIKSKTVHHSKATTTMGVKRRVLGDITERERINRANLETLRDTCGMFKKSTPTLIVTPSSRSSGVGAVLHASNENGPVMATVEPSSTMTSTATSRRQPRQSSASAGQKEKSFSKIYR